MGKYGKMTYFLTANQSFSKLYVQLQKSGKTAKNKSSASLNTEDSLVIFGGEYGARTRDLLTASQTRSQLRQFPTRPGRVLCYDNIFVTYIQEKFSIIRSFTYTKINGLGVIRQDPVSSIWRQQDVFEAA